jgi:uncharacterized pyridoxamine 5'-phosphate oxidase family protein
MVSPGLKKFIESNAMALSTIGINGKPHNIAVAYVKVIDDRLIITNAHIKESVKNIEKNENVSIAIWNKEWEKACVGYEIMGKAENHISGKWFDFVCSMPDNEGYKINSAIVVKIIKMKKLKS